MITILIYENFAAFEIVLASYLLKTNFDIKVVAEQRIVKSMDGLTFYADELLADYDSSQSKCLIIPGGMLTEHVASYISPIAQKFFDDKKVVGAICSGTGALISTNILLERQFVTNVDITDADPLIKQNVKSDKGLVVDRNLVTALPEKHVDFAIEIGQMLSIYKDVADYDETQNFFRGNNKESITIHN